MKIRRTFALLIAIVMVFSLSSMAFATDSAPLTMTATINGTTYTFATDSYTYTNPSDNTSYTAYTALADFPAGTDLSSNIGVDFTYNGSAIKINGEDVTSAIATLKAQGEPYPVNFGSSVTKIEVVQTNGTAVYYASATAGNFSVSMNINYDTLGAFAATETGSYYQRTGYTRNTYMDVVTDDQKTMADFAYGYFSGLGLTTMTETVSSGTTPVSVLADYATLNSLSVTDSAGEQITAATTYVDAIEGVDMTYAGTYSYSGWGGASGGWMFSVQRGGETQFPGISAGYFKLMPGDVITWAYTCDLGNDLGAPMLY